MKLLVSACLLGESCRYDGKSKPVDLSFLPEGTELIPICPEKMGGLPTPRPPCELKENKAVRKDGTDCTDAYQKGAHEALRLAEENGVKAALLKEKSPSCGCGKVYDGTFTGTLVEGNGITASLLLSRGIAVFGENEPEALLAFAAKTGND